jgi:hypothetical protein
MNSRIQSCAGQICCLVILFFAPVLTASSQNQTGDAVTGQLWSSPELQLNVDVQAVPSTDTLQTPQASGNWVSYDWPQLAAIDPASPDMAAPVDQAQPDVTLEQKSVSLDNQTFSSPDAWKSVGWYDLNKKNYSLHDMTKIMILLQGVTFGGLYWSGTWDDDDDEPVCFDNWVDGFKSGPESDDDSFAWNYIAHPLAGSEFYLIARDRGVGMMRCMLYSFMMSTVWEYGFENFAEHPSTNDLIITPVLGSVVGELRFRAKEKLLADGNVSARDRFLIAFLDPLDLAFEGLPGEAPKFGLAWKRSF